MRHVKQYENFIDTLNILDSTSIIGIILGYTLGGFLSKITKYFQDKHVVKKVYNRLQSDEKFEIKKINNEFLININNEFLLTINKNTKKLNINKLPIKRFYLGSRKTEVELSDEDYQYLLSIIQNNQE